VGEAKKLLRIVVSAVGPLALREMNVVPAMVVGYMKTSISNQTRGSISNHVQKHPWSLCVINSKIHLIHQTAKGFLVRGKLGVDSRKGNWKNLLEPSESNLVLARICISCLRFAIFESHPLVVDDRDYCWTFGSVNRCTNEHDFLDYAVKHWAGHFREAKVMETELLGSALGVCDAQSN
jgi:hypothetical protein